MTFSTDDAWLTAPTSTIAPITITIAIATATTTQRGSRFLASSGVQASTCRRSLLISRFVFFRCTLSGIRGVIRPTSTHVMRMTSRASSTGSVPADKLVCLDCATTAPVAAQTVAAATSAKPA
ncbi:hypothetical protein ASF88_00020 [Leifsonia sp. Leaf336]|nr:hypothetical protein ASF88_00020 [Leifsonia sp. Leaf336]